MKALLNNLESFVKYIIYEQVNLKELKKTISLYHPIKLLIGFQNKNHANT